MRLTMQEKVDTTCAVLVAGVMVATVVGLATGAVAVTGPVEVERIEEDEAGWDCRLHGNRICAATVEGETILIQYEGGKPVEVRAFGD